MGNWVFTTDEKIEAENGNWLAYQVPEDCVGAGKWVLTHVDFPDCARTEGHDTIFTSTWTRIVEDEWQEFQDWLQDQKQETALDRLESYVNHPGNWGFLDGRRGKILGMIEDVKEELCIS